MNREILRNPLPAALGLIAMLAVVPVCLAQAGPIEKSTMDSTIRSTADGLTADESTGDRSPVDIPIEDSARSMAELPEPDLDQAFATREMESVYAWLEGLSGPAAETAKALRARIAMIRLSGQADSNDRSSAMLDEALESHPDSVELLLLRASLGLGTIDEAGSFGKLRIARAVRDDLERALEIDPTHVRAIVANIQFHDQAPRIAGGRDRVADALLEQLDSIDPAESAFVRFDRLRRNDQPAEARAQLETAVDRARTPKPARESMLAAMLHAEGQHERALELSRSVVERYPTYGPGWYQVGRIAIEAGVDPGMAVDALERYLDMPRWPGDPESADARRLLEQIERADND